MDLREAMLTWRSVRAFRPDPVPRAAIADLLRLAVQVSTPPAAADRWAFAVLEGAERIEGWGARAKAWAAANRPPGEPGWAWTERPEFRVFWGAPAVVLICARQGAAEAPFDCCRAGQNLALAAHAAGLGACWIGAALPWLRSAGVAAELGLPAGFDPSVALLLGTPRERPPPRPRPEPPIVWAGG